MATIDNNPKDNVQITQTNTNKKRRAKRASPITDPDCVYAFKTIPVSLAMVESMAEELLDWPAKNPSAKTITEFYLSKGLKQETYNRLVLRHPVLKEAHEITMRRLGERLWGRAVDNEVSWKPVHFMLHNYAPEFKEADKYHAFLKEEENKATGIQVVYLERAPHTKELDEYERKRDLRRQERAQGVPNEVPWKQE